MKTTGTLTALLLVSSAYAPLSLAQTDCTRYLGGVISCTGPNGYQMEAREHLNGQTSFYDSKGNQGMVTRTLNGGIDVSPTVVGRGGAPSVTPLITGRPNDNLNPGSRIVSRTPHPLHD